MELLFTITPMHTQIRVKERLDREMLEYDQQHAQLMGYVTRLTSPLLFVLSMAVGALSIYFPERQFTTEKIVAFVLSATIITLIWRPVIGRLLSRAARARRAGPSMYFRSLNRRLHQRLLQSVLKTTEGTYHLQFDDQGFTLTNSSTSAKGYLAWAEIVRIKETHDFYFITSAKLDRKNRAYCIPKNSDVMEENQYQQGLELLLSRITASALLIQTNTETCTNRPVK